MVQKPAFLGNTSYHGRVRGAAVGRRLDPSQQAIGPPWPGHSLTACLAPTNYHAGAYGMDRSDRARQGLGPWYPPARVGCGELTSASRPKSLRCQCLRKARTKSELLPYEETTGTGSHPAGSILSDFLQFFAFRSSHLATRSDSFG